MINLMDKEYIKTKVVVFMKEHSLMGKKVVMEFKNGQMVHNIKVNFKMEK